MSEAIQNPKLAPSLRSGQALEHSEGSKIQNPLAAIPLLGAGLGYRRELGDEMLGAHEAIDFVEIIADNYIHSPEALDELARICAVFPVIPHGVGLSVGAVVPPNRDYLRAIKRVSDLTGSPYYSEHLCLTRAPGIDIGHLAPL